MANSELKSTASSNLSEVLEIQLVETIVRNVPLTGLNELEITPKYRLLSEHGEQLTRHLPDVLIIGVKKSGTRALLEFVRLHPDVRAAGCEVHFFDRHYNRGLHWYRNHMPPTIDGQITMEKTPSYFITKEVPSRVNHMNPSTKYEATFTRLIFYYYNHWGKWLATIALVGAKPQIELPVAIFETIKSSFTGIPR